MNPDTRHLIWFENGVPLPENYHELPEDLNRAAKRALKGKSEVYIKGNSRSKLAQWAKKMRAGSKKEK